jgi:hypothetical protein
MGSKNEESDLIPGRTKTFFLLQNIQIGSGVHPASYAVGMRETFQGSKAAAAPSLPLTQVTHHG